MPEWYHFNRRERNGLFVLITLLVSLIVFYVAMPYIYEKKEIQTDLDPELIKSLRKFDSIRIARQKDYEVSKTKYQEERVAKTFESKRAPKSKHVVSAELREFDPNIVTIDELETLAMPKWLAQRIINYREKGGTFKIKSDLSKIYGFPDSLYQQLEPYIQLPDTVTKKNSTKEFNSISLELVALNTATTEELQQIRGIGKAYSRRIVKYRDLLGGYVHVNQLQEVYQLNDSLFNAILPFVTINDSTEINQLNINEAKRWELEKHPYITYQMASDWVAYRDKHGKFNSPNELLSSGLLNESLYARIVPYIRVR